MGETGRARWRLCTIAARNYLPSVELLVESFRAHHRHVPVSVLLVDGSPEESYRDLPFEVVFPSALPLPPNEFGRMATYYDVTELSTGLKPFLLQALLDRGDDVVMYLDPDIEVFKPLDDLFALAEDADLALTPHVTQPIPRDGYSFAEESLLLSGHFNLGFVALSARSRPFLEYWKERTLRYAVRDVGSGYFTDQRWIDAVPSLFPHVVVRDRGCNVAYWNLHERTIEHTEEGWTAAGEALRFFHFSGHRAEDPFVLSAHLAGIPRVRLDENPFLRRLLHERAQRLAAVQNGTRAVPYRFDRTALGLRVDPPIRRAYWKAVIEAEAAGAEPPPHAFEHDGGAAFLEWLRAPVGPSSVVPRHLEATWESRADLQRTFPDLNGADADRLLEWATVDEHYLTHLSSPLRVNDHIVGQPGVNLVGYLHGEFGVAAAARMVGGIVRSAGLPLATCVLDAFAHRHEASFINGASGTPFNLTLLAMNADALRHYAHTADYRALRHTRRVGIWYWEVGDLPDEYRPAFGLVDEVWCASQHIRDALAPHAQIPVRVHPVAFPPHIPSALERRDIDLPDGRFVFGFAFDYLSSVKRKNPAGIIEAYQRAFTPDDGAALVLKSLNSARSAGKSAEIRHLAGDRPDILFVDRHYDELEMAAFYQHLDVYVSLHRSEGLGLTMASAMAAGVPVIATGWSGNRAFMDDGDALLVPYELVPVGTDAPPYPPTASWADPDLDAAAGYMRELFDHQPAARALGACGRAALEARSDRRRATEWFRERFEALTGVVAA
jgi:glycosyltransferase involved in cell wall biosynthesis